MCKLSTSPALLSSSARVEPAWSVKGWSFTSNKSVTTTIFHLSRCFLVGPSDEAEWASLLSIHRFFVQQALHAFWLSFFSFFSCYWHCFWALWQLFALYSKKKIYYSCSISKRRFAICTFLFVNVDADIVVPTSIQCSVRFSIVIQAHAWMLNSGIISLQHPSRECRDLYTDTSCSQHHTNHRDKNTLCNEQPCGLHLATCGVA